MKSSRAWLLLLALLAAACRLGGCAAVPGPVLANAGVNVAASQSSGFRVGSLEGTYVATFEDARRAIASAAEDLGYKLKRHSGGTWNETVYLIPRNGDSIRIRTRIHTAMVLSLSVRVGLLGDQPVSRMILAQIEQRLSAKPATAPAPEDEPGQAIPQPEPQPVIPPTTDPPPPPASPR